MEYQLSELFDLQMGKTPDRNNPSYWNNNKNKWISIADLSKSGKYIIDTKETISNSAVISSGIKPIPPNTVVMSFKLSIGKTAITKEQIYSNEAIMAFIDKKIVQINPSYLYYLLANKKWDQGSNKAVMGITLNKASLSQYKVNIPNMHIQNNVVTKLDKLTQLIETQKKQMIVLDNLIKSRFVEMFGDPEINPNNYPIKKLRDIAEYWNGLTYKPENVSNDGVIVLRSSNIQDSKLDFENIIRVTCKISEKKYVKKNDILMCSRNGSSRLVGKVALIDNITEPMSFGAFMMIIRSIYNPYLMIYFQLPIFKTKIATGATTTINQITSKMLDEIKIPVPKLEHIYQFSAFIEQVNKSKFIVDLIRTLMEMIDSNCFPN